MDNHSLISFYFSSPVGTYWEFLSSHKFGQFQNFCTVCSHCPLEAFWKVQNSNLSNFSIKKPTLLFNIYLISWKVPSNISPIWFISINKDEMLTLSQGIVFRTCSSAPSMSRLKMSTFGFPRARRIEYKGKHWIRIVLLLFSSNNSFKKSFEFDI